MSAGPGVAQVLLLGAFAGLTIYLGLPLARLRGLSDRTRAGLSAGAVGILLFLFYDVLSNAHELAIVPLAAGDWRLTVAYTALLAFGFSSGCLLLLQFERWFSQRLREADGLPARGPGGERAALDPLHLSSMIAVGIGMHNLSEGLAIGASYATGALALALVLVIGFAAHNATEGFGILGPGMMAGRSYSWRRLAVLGLIGGGPTFLGTGLGYLLGSDASISSPVSVLFYGLAAGAILYVVLQMSRPLLAPASRSAAIVGVVVGFLLGLLSDLLVTLGGA